MQSAFAAPTAPFISPLSKFNITFADIETRHSPSPSHKRQKVNVVGNGRVDVCGSLGQGLSVAAGLAIAARADNTGRKTYCIIGDGEAREGQITEALDFIMDHQLASVLPIFNCNSYGQAGSVSDQQSPAKLAAKLEAAGFEVAVIDGHAPNEIKTAFDAFNQDGRTQPMAVVAKTVKGWGAPSMQGGTWHRKPATGKQLN